MDEQDIIIHSGGKMEYTYAKLLMKENMFPSNKTYYNGTLLVTKGKKQFLYDQDGQKYLDFYSGVATASMGYCDEFINEAVIKQLKEVQHVPGFYLNSLVLELARTLAGKVKNDRYKVLFCNSGSEGIEYITLLARLYKKDGYILSLSHGYHGMTLFANYLTGVEGWKHHGEVELKAYKVCTPYCYRCKFNKSRETCSFECALEIEDAIKSLGADKFAGFLFETVLGVGGVIVPPEEYFNIALKIVSKYGGLSLVDEVQTGIGRTGQWYGFQNYHIEPDAFCLGKGLGNGLPIGAVLAKSYLAELTSDLMLYSTFGGNPVACASSFAVLEKIEKYNMLRNIKDRGDYLIRRLQELYEFDFVGDVRGIGLMAGVEFVRSRKLKEPHCELALKVLNKLKEYNLLVGIGGIYRNVIRIAPPFIIETSDIDALIEGFKRTFLYFGRKDIA